MQKVPIHDLKIGDKVLKFDRNWLGTDFLSHKFTVKDLSIIDRLHKNGIEYVFVDDINEQQKKLDSLFDGGHEEIITQVKEHAKESMLDIKDLHEASAVYTESVKIVSDVLHDVRTGKMFNSGAVKHVAENIATITLRNKGVLTSVTKLKKFDDYTFHHSMNVSIYAASLAAHLGVKEEGIARIAQSGLMHDVGKMLIPQEILNKPDKLSDAEFSIMKEHVERGYDFLLKQGTETDLLKLVREHHERSDGTGYPRGLKDKEISIEGKIGAVVDIYDAMTSDRVYHKGMMATSALKLMFQWTDSHINKSIFEFFIKNIGIYPVGSLVIMSTRELAIVGKINNNRPTDPVVITFMDKNGEQLPIKVTDLSKSAVDGQKILGLLNPENISIPSEVYRYIDDLNRIV